MPKKPFLSDILMVAALAALICLPVAIGKEAPARRDGREKHRGADRLSPFRTADR